METFYFSLDTKVTDWYRTDFEIKANSQEQANELAIKFVKDLLESKNISKNSED